MEEEEEEVKLQEKTKVSNSPQRGDHMTHGQCLILDFYSTGCRQIFPTCVTVTVNRETAWFCAFRDKAKEKLPLAHSRTSKLCLFSYCRTTGGVIPCCLF